MKKRMISLGITAALFLICVFLILVIEGKTFLGPYFKNVKEEERLYHQMMEKLDAKEADYLGSYRLNETVYVAKVTDSAGTEWVWYDENLTLLASRSILLLSEEELEALKREMNMENAQIKLGWYNDAPVIVLADEEQELLIDFDTKSQVLLYKKKVIG